MLQHSWRSISQESGLNAGSTLNDRTVKIISIFRLLPAFYARLWKDLWMRPALIGMGRWEGRREIILRRVVHACCSIKGQCVRNHLQAITGTVAQSFCTMTMRITMRTSTVICCLSPRAVPVRVSSTWKRLREWRMPASNKQPAVCVRGSKAGMRLYCRSNPKVSKGDRHVSLTLTLFCFELLVRLSIKFTSGLKLVKTVHPFPLYAPMQAYKNIYSSFWWMIARGWSRPWRKCKMW